MTCRALLRAQFALRVSAVDALTADWCAGCCLTSGLALGLWSVGVLCSAEPPSLPFVGRTRFRVQPQVISGIALRASRSTCPRTRLLSPSPQRSAKHGVGHPTGDDFGTITPPPDGEVCPSYLESPGTRVHRTTKHDPTGHATNHGRSCLGSRCWRDGPASSSAPSCDRNRGAFSGKFTHASSLGWATSPTFRARTGSQPSFYIEYFG